MFKKISTVLLSIVLTLPIAVSASASPVQSVTQTGATVSKNAKASTSKASKKTTKKAKKKVVKKTVKKRKILTTAAKNKKIAAAQVKKRKWNSKQYSCLVTLWNKESRWNHKAKNRYSGAYGIPQSLPGNKMRSAGKDWKTNPATQIKWGLSYIKQRYKTPCGALSAHARKGWY